MAWGSKEVLPLSSFKGRMPGLGEDGTILIGGNEERGRSIYEPSSNVKDATPDHGNNYVHLIYVDTWRTNNVESIFSCCDVGQESSGIITGEEDIGD